MAGLLPRPEAAQCDGGGRSAIRPVGFVTTKIPGFCLTFVTQRGVPTSVSGEVVEGEMLKGDEVYQVALRRRHAVWKEVDQRVKELRPLSVRLIDVGETCQRKSS